MKRNIVLFFMMIIIITGCSSNSAINNGKSNISDSQNEINISEEKLKSQYGSMEWKCSVPLNNISDISGFDHMFITKNGDLYLFSFTQLFSSTNDYCKKVDSDYKFERFINGAIVTIDNKLLAYHNGNFVERMVGWTGAFDYSKFDQYSNMILFSKNFDPNQNYAVVEGKEVFELNNIYDNEYVPIGVNKVKIGQLNNTENYVGGYYQIIKTTENYYMYSIINKEQCDMYADVECEYGLKRIDDISDEYENILYYNGKYIIFKDDINHIYTNEK
ncbi:MAG: hypothetical protein E7313_07620 [Clostridiales bacterium]|nr:hypothetical protein [Clostridiales bacterium]